MTKCPMCGYHESTAGLSYLTCLGCGRNFDQEGPKAGFDIGHVKPVIDIDKQEQTTETGGN